MLETVASKWLDKNFSRGQLEEEEGLDGNGSVIFLKDGDFVLIINFDSESVGISNKQIWRPLEDIFSMEERRIKFLIKKWLVENFEPIGKQTISHYTIHKNYG